jgi:HAD superfamily hydrolase (TIGR01459 family)
VVSQLDGLGVPRAAWSGFVTSGDATRDLLAARAPGKVWRIGPDRDAPLYAGFDLDLTGTCEDADFIGCSGLYDDETEIPEDYRDRLAVAAERGLTFICANPDRVVQRGDKLIFCAGALADLYESLGGEVIMAGKPFAPIYDMAIAKAAELTGKPVDRDRVLCIGDGSSPTCWAPRTRNWPACSSPRASTARPPSAPTACSIPKPCWPAGRRKGRGHARGGRSGLVIADFLLARF